MGTSGQPPQQVGGHQASQATAGSGRGLEGPSGGACRGFRGQSRRTGASRASSGRSAAQRPYNAEPAILRIICHGRAAHRRRYFAAKRAASADRRGSREATGTAVACVGTTSSCRQIRAGRIHSDVSSACGSPNGASASTPSFTGASASRAEGTRRIHADVPVACCSSRGRENRPGGFYEGFRDAFPCRPHAA